MTTQTSHQQRSLVVSIFWWRDAHHIETHRDGEMINRHQITSAVANKLHHYFRHHCKQASMFPGGGTAFRL